MKKLVLKTFILFIIAFFSQDCLSQSNFIPGYIITNQNDSISGFINYKNWNKNPNKIEFKNNLDSATIIYTPNNIIELSVNNNLYASRTFDVEISPRNNNNLEKNPNLKIKTVSDFVQVLYKGKKSLYYHKDVNDNFYINNDGSLMLLTHKKYKKDNNSIAKNDKFKGQLQLYLNDCPSISSNINRASYNSNSISQIFKKYYTCIEDEPEYSKTPKTRIEKGVFIGASTSSLKFNENDKYPYLSEKFETSTNFSFGVFCNIILSEDIATWSLNNEIQYYSYKTSNRYEDVENENIYTTSDSKLEHSFIKLNVLPKYKFPINNKLSLFFNGGATIGLVISEENSREIDSKVYSNETRATKHVIPTDNKELGLILGAGIDFNKFSLEVRSETTNGATTRLTNGKLNKLFLLLAYKI